MYENENNIRNKLNFNHIMRKLIAENNKNIDIKYILQLINKGFVNINIIKRKLLNKNRKEKIEKLLNK